MQLPSLPAVIGRTISLIVVHCSATLSGQWLPGTGPSLPVTQRRTAAGVIDSWHAARGFKRLQAAVTSFNARLPHIGYHYVIDVDGYVWTGRDLCEIGAHVQGHNANSVGICMVGGAEADAGYTPEQWDALAALVTLLGERLQVPLVKRSGIRASKGVCGHRDLSPDTNGDGVITQREWLKTCPGFDVGTWLGRGMRPLPQHLAASVVAP